MLEKVQYNLKQNYFFLGLRAVLSGNLDLEKCSDKQFSPFIYWSNDSVKCPYQKSICADEGQVLFDNGSDSKDVKCVCDYRRGYQYIFKPKDECSCSPMNEDCSCILKRCLDDSFILTSGKSIVYTIHLIKYLLRSDFYTSYFMIQ